MAEQLEFFPIQSPCRGICQSDEKGFCRGCMRTRDERFNWQAMSDAQKQDVLRLCSAGYGECALRKPNRMMNRNNLLFSSFASHVYSAFIFC